MSLTLSQTGDQLARRAYELMARAEAKFGHRSAAHVVAWTALVDAGYYRDGKNPELNAFQDIGEISMALDLVDLVTKSHAPLSATNKLEAMAQRPRMMAKVIDTCPYCHGSGKL